MGGLEVVHVVRQFAPSVGGLEDAVLNLARQQRRRGLAPRVVTLDCVFTDRNTRLPAQDMVGGIPVTRLRWHGSSRYPLAPSILRAVRGAGLVHVHGIDFFFDFLAATRPLHRKPMVASTHGGFFHTSFGGSLKRVWFGSITRASLRAYDAIIACSENDASMFARLSPPRMAVLENGIDQSKFANCGPALRDPRRLLTFGRFAAHKRIDRLFWLLAALARQDPDWHLVVAGSPADQDLATLQAAARHAGVEARVTFKLAPSDADIARELSQATWFASASGHEGFGLAPVEAAAAGLIPVLSDIAPFKRLAARLGDGIVGDPMAPDAWAAALTESAARGVLPARSAAVVAAAQSYDWRGVADEHVRVYQTVLSGTARAWA